MIAFESRVPDHSRSRVLVASLAALGLSLGCRGPELRVSRLGLRNEPFHLRVQLPEGPDREARETMLRANLNATLKANHALVAAEDQQERDPILLIQVEEMSRGDVTKQTISSNAAMGATFGAVGGFQAGAETASAVSTGSPNLKETRDSLVFVVVTTVAGATVGAAAGTVGGVSDGVARSVYHDLRLGYRPKHIVCKVSYASSGNAMPLQIGSTDAWAVLKEMRPMSKDDAHQSDKLHLEEARALAIIVDRILNQAMPHE